MARVALPLWLALTLLLGGCASSGPKPVETPPATAEVQQAAPAGGGLDAPNWVERHPYTTAGIALVTGAVVAVVGIAFLAFSVASHMS
jgi:hypothetical protein